MKIYVTVFTLASVIIAGSVMAHSGAKGIVKERMSSMEDMGDKSKIVADMFKGKSEFDRAALAEAAEAFVMHGSRMTELFVNTKESRTGNKTEALPKIWNEWDDFNALITEFISRSKDLKDIVVNTEEPALLKKAFFHTTKSCSGCHKRFRKPKE